MHPFGKEIQKVSDKILNDPVAAIAKQLRIPAALTIGIIINFALYLIDKRKKGIFDREDQLQLATEIINFVQFLAETNYLAFLVITEQFEVIGKIFAKEERLKAEVAVALWLEQQKEEAQKLQILAGEQQHAFLNHQKQYQEALLQAGKQGELLIIMHYLHLLKCERDIRINFYQEQIKLFDEVYVQRMARIDTIDNDTRIDVDDKNDLRKLKKDYFDAKTVLDAMLIHKDDGSIDIDALKTKADAAEQMDIHFRDKFRTILTDLVRIYPHLSELSEQENRHVEKYQKDLTQKKQAVKEQLDEIKPCIESTKKIVKKELESSMRELVDILNNADVSNFSESKRVEFAKGLDELDGYMSELNHTDNIQQVTNKFAEKLTHLQEIGRPHMSFALYEKLKEKRYVLEGLRNRINANLSILEAPTNHIQQATSAANTTVLMRIQTQSDRAASLHDGQEAFGTDIVSIEGDVKENLVQFASRLPKLLRTKEKNGDFKPEEKPLVSSIQEICVQFAARSDAVDAYKVKLVYKLLSGLKKEHHDLGEFLSKLDMVMNALNNPPHLGN